MPTGHRRWTSATLGWAIALALGSLALSFVPLFDLLGYEWCFAMALAASVAGLHLGARRAARARAQASPSERAAADERPLGAVARLWAGAFSRGLAALAPAVVIICANALRVRNCDLAGGFVWLALLPVASAAVATAVGVGCGLAVGRGGFCLGLGLLAASLAWALWRFWAAPPINAYDPFGGYFPGTLYDEEVAVPAALWWARAYHLAAAAAALAAAALFLDGSALRLRLRAARGRLRVAAAVALAGAIAATLGASHARLGFSRDADDIARALGGERVTEHFVLHYSPTGPFARDLDLYARDHELRWRELAQLFGVAPAGRVHAFLFDSAAQKQALMGAAHTSVAKPWRRELYLQYEAWPHSVLPHELAHVFAGAFGDPIFHASRRGLAFNVGLIEGTAVAAAWHGAPLTADQQVHVMRAHGIAPPLRDVLSLRFLRYNGSAAYAVAGSFCRFLLETRGAAPLERVYRDGGDEASFRAAYGVPLAQLEAEWQRRVDQVPVPAAASKIAEDALSHPSVFHKVCAHELARRREAAAQLGPGDPARALAMLESVCRDDPDDPEILVELMSTARGAHRDDDAARWARALLAHPKATPTDQARAQMLLGDLALVAAVDGSARPPDAARLETARAAYAAVEAAPLDEATARLITVKRLLARMPEPPPAIVHFLVDPPAGRDAAVDLATTAAFARSAAAPEQGLALYLWARQLVEHAQWTQAADAFERARALGLPDARFVKEADRLDGVACFRAGQLERARVAFHRLADDAAPDEPAVRLGAEDWLRRIDFVDGAGALAKERP